MMILLLMAASLAAQSEGVPHRIARVRPAPCQAVPSLCITGGEMEGPRLVSDTSPTSDGKMNAYRFDARPCRIIGNLDCPKRANRQIFRLGEPIERTLARSFGAD
ncbi:MULTISPECIES: hypothetical protein [Sphingobium]|uniref:Uncharacterized protein n=1 Tax=Sphingobium chungbukense TaxID=56193 RepID=A0A0M3AQA9_9SPHN|nr:MULTISPECIES: hypothetical protein [Sphingobium]KKW92382.1 hypothetical protein YP76_10755 [Sphingobium chungbukense]PJG48755.1 hypothetical protein CAF53_11280 [Sphingobium sp. LB126]